MDKELLQSFNNLSVALQALSDSLQKNAERETDGTSAIADALKTLDVSDQLRMLNTGIEQLAKDGEKLQKAQNDILGKIASVAEKQKEQGKKIETTAEAVRSKKDSGGPDYVPDKSQKSKITDGVKMIVLIAGGLLAVGFAFKLIGAVNIKTVLALSLALPIIAIAYKKIAETKTDLKALVASAKGMVIFSAAVAASSFLLARTTPIAFQKVLTAIAIAGLFTVVSFGLGRLVKTAKDMDTRGLLRLPLVMVASSAAIMASSYFLARVETVTPGQAFTSILIATTFAVLSLSIGRLAKSVAGVSIKGLFMMPFVLVGASLAILASSYLLAQVQPVSPPQLLTAIGIAIAFTAIGFGLEGIAKAASKVSVLGAVMLPIVLVATSWAIAKSSEYLAMTRPITLMQFITAVAVSAVFVVLSFALPRLAKAVEKINIAKAALMPIVFVTLSLALVASSYILSEIREMSITRMFNVVLQSVMLTIVAVAMGAAVYVLGKMGLDSESGVKKAAAAGATILILSATIALASMILAGGEYTNAPGWRWSLEAGLSIVVFGLLAYGIIKLGIKPTMAIEGGIAIVVIAATILATDFILGAGDYTKKPDWEWTWQTGAAILAYGLLAVAASFGIVPITIGAVAIAIIAAAILATDYILSSGTYEKYPPMEWTGTTLLIMGGFGLMMTAFAVLSPLLVLGAFSLGIIAAAVLAVDSILSEGDFTKGPTFDYAKGVALIMATYGTIMTATGLMLPLLMLGKKSMRLISEAIVESAGILAGGNFTGGPDVKWASGVSLALGAFAPIFKAVSSQGIIGAIFGGGASAEQLSTAIRMISQSIVDAARFFAGANVAFTGGPSKAWSEGVGKAIGAFAPVLSAIKDRGALGAIFGGATTTDQMSSAIRTISFSIVEAAAIFGASTAVFRGGPSESWSEGVGKAIGAFAPVFDRLQSSGLMGMITGVSAKDMSDAVVMVSASLVAAAMVLQNPLVNFDVYPKKEWSEGMGTAIVAFGPALKWASENGGFFGADAEDLKETIIAIADSMVEVSKRLAGGKFDVAPNKGYFDTLRASFDSIFKLYSDTDKQDIDDFEPVLAVAEAIAATSRRLASGDYSLVVPPTWDTTTKSIFRTQTDLVGMSGPLDAEANALVMVAASAIVSTARTLSSSDYSLVVPATWDVNAKSLFRTQADLVAMSGLLTTLGGVLVMVAAGSIVSTARTLLSGDYSLVVPATWDASAKSLFRTQADLVGMSGLLTTLGNILVLVTAGSIVSTARTLASGDYSLVVPTTWDASAKSLFQTQSDLGDIVGIFGIFDILSNIAVLSAAGTIADTANVLGTGDYYLDVSPDWGTAAVGLFNTYDRMRRELSGVGFFSGLLGIFDRGPSLVAVAQEISSISRILAAGQFREIPIGFMDGVYRNVRAYMRIVDMLSFRSFGGRFFDRIFGAAVDIVKIASDYDRLAASMTRLSASINSIDIEKMAALKSLTGTVVLMSLMDTAQFRSMMEELEDKAGVLAGALADANKANQSPGGGGAAVSMRAQAPAAPQVSPEMKTMLETLSRIEQRLAAISSSATNISSYVNQLRAGGGNNSLKSKK